MLSISRDLSGDHDCFPDKNEKTIYGAIIHTYIHIITKNVLTCIKIFKTLF